MRVGIVGSGLGEGLAKPLAVAADMPGLTAFPIAYEREEDAPALTAAALGDVDAIVFLGPVPHALAREALPPDLPAVHIPYDGSGLVKALFDLHRMCGEDAPFSIDSITAAEVLRVVDEVGGSRDAVHAIQDEAAGPLPRHVLVSRHLELARRGTTHAAITYVRSVHHELKANGLTNVYVEPLASAVRGALRQAALLGRARAVEGTQLVVVMARFADGGPEPDDTKRRQLDLAVQSFLLALAAHLEASLVPAHDGVHALITTNAGLDKSADWEAAGIREIERIGEMVGRAPKVGIGFGGTSREAEENARHALERAEGDDAGSTYVVSRDRAVIGPLGSTSTPMLRHTRVLDGATLARARAAGVNPASMALIQTLNGRDAFDADRLAHLLGLSVRSARRIAQRLVNAGLAQVAGEEQHLTGRGRPRQLYRLVPVVTAPPMERPD